MKIDKKKIYSEIVLPIKEATTKDDFKKLDELLEYTMT